MKKPTFAFVILVLYFSFALAYFLSFQNRIVIRCLECPYCESEAVYIFDVPDHDIWTTRGYIRNCSNCGKEMFIIVYYDGEVVVEN